MFLVNNKPVQLSHFNDNTLKISNTNLVSINEPDIEIKWFYNSDEEIFALACIIETVRDYMSSNDIKPKIDLIIPYLPHARQDREVSGNIFSLKYLAQFLNSLNLNSIQIVDHHSEASLLLLNNLIELPDPFEEFIKSFDGILCYPDKGAAQKYLAIYKNKDFIIGQKHRNYEGQIDSYNLLNFNIDFVSKGVIIRDDICSSGETILRAAKALKAQGVQHIIVCIAHCENTIVSSELINGNYIDELWTTDSIYTNIHEKIKIKKRYR